MGRAPCCEKVGLKRGRWTQEEDDILSKYIQTNGEGSWRSLPKNAGLLRCGKSCRLRWINYLRNDLKRGNISTQEDDIIIKLHASLGNKWSLIASQLTGRTDNEIKNYWNSHLSRKIDTFRRPYGQPLPIILNNAVSNKLASSATKKGGRTSRAAMKKNSNNYTTNRMGKFTSSPLDQNVKETGHSNLENHCNVVPLPSTPTLEKETLPSATISSWDDPDQKSEKHNIGVPRSYQPSQVVQERMLVISEVSDDNVVTNKNGIINYTTTTSSELQFYGPHDDHHHQGLETDIMSFHDINTAYGGHYQIDTAMSGEGEISMGWGWDGLIDHQNVQHEENQENGEWLSWLWENDNTSINDGDQEKITQNSEKQEAFVAWLLS